MRRFRRYRFLGSIPLFGWLFIQLAATGLLGAVPTHAASHGFGAAPFIITICTPDGVKEIALAGSGHQAPNPAPSGLGGCEWCRFLDTPVDLAGPVGGAGFIFSPAREPGYRSETTVLEGRHERDAYRVRAPPA